MKKLLSILLILVGVELLLTAQTFFEKQERRVYYLDVTASMTGYNNSQNIWQNVISNLKSAIDSIQDERTEIVIKTFTDSLHPVETLVSACATSEGKETIKNSIDTLDPSINTNVHTDIDVTFTDFYNHEISKTKVNYFFLMTDGCQYSPRAQYLNTVISNWNKKTDNGKEHIYGFYVMLCDAAYSADIEKQIKAQNRLWIVQSASVNINLIRPKKKSFYCDIRKKDTERYVDIPMTGRLDGLQVTGENEYCRTNNTTIIKDNTLRVYLSNKKHLAQIPKVSTLNLEISTPTDQYSYLLSKEISVHCDNLTPWTKIGIGIGTSILFFLLIWYLLIKPTKYRTYKTFKKQVLVKQDGKITHQKRVVFTGARMVVFSNKEVHQSFINRMFTGKIITWVSPEFTKPLTFKPTQNRKNSHISGAGYVAMPNPIPRNGITTIENQELKIDIILN